MERYKNPVRVNGHEMNVFFTGNGEKCIVFLAGAMVTSPILEYKPLWEKLTGDFRIAIVEKAGYGFSQGNTGASRDVETLAEESREALRLAGIQPPYLLAPHSYSGLEAVYWAMHYPQEIAGILGLDMVTPPFSLAQAEELPMEKKLAMVDKQNRLFVKVQKSKLLQKLYVKTIFGQALVWKQGFFSGVEREIYRDLFFQNFCNSEMRDEQAMSTQNAQLVKAANLQGIPGLLFISDMDGVIKKSTWKDENSAYAQRQGWKIMSAKSHQLYAEQPEEIAAAWREFAQSL